MMPSLVELSKAMTPNKLKALNAAWKAGRGTKGVSDRAARDASYAQKIILRHAQGKRVKAANDKLERLRRTLAQFDAPPRSGGGGPSIDWRQRDWREAKGLTRREREHAIYDGQLRRNEARVIANDQRLKPRRLP